MTQEVVTQFCAMSLTLDGSVNSGKKIHYMKSSKSITMDLYEQFIHQCSLPNTTREFQLKFPLNLSSPHFRSQTLSCVFGRSQYQRA